MRGAVRTLWMGSGQGYVSQACPLPRTHAHTHTGARVLCPCEYRRTAAAAVRSWVGRRRCRVAGALSVACSTREYPHAHAPAARTRAHTGAQPERATERSKRTAQRDNARKRPIGDADGVADEHSAPSGTDAPARGRGRFESVVAHVAAGTHTRAHARTHTHTHTRARTRTPVHGQVLSPSRSSRTRRSPLARAGTARYRCCVAVRAGMWPLYCSNITVMTVLQQGHGPLQRSAPRCNAAPPAATTQHRAALRARRAGSR
jgi:hypothetical protein